MERCWIEKCINKLLTTERGEYAVATIWQPCAFMRLMIALKERIAMHSVRRYSALTLIGLLPLASLPNSVAERAKLLVQTGAGLIGSSSENPKWLRNKSDYVVTYPFRLLRIRSCISGIVMVAEAGLEVRAFHTVNIGSGNYMLKKGYGKGYGMLQSAA